MRFGKLFLTIISLLLAGVALFGEHLLSDDSLTVSVVSATGETETIIPWKNELDGEAYFFLPGYTDLSTAEIRVGKDGNYLLEGSALENGTACDVFSLDTSYALTSATGEKIFAHKLNFLQSEGLATIFLDTKSGSMEDIFRDKEYEELSRLRVYGVDGELEVNVSDAFLSGRGNSTWEENKKPLNLELSQDTELLGMQPAKKWVLLANAKDVTNLRNKLVLDFANRIGMPYSPDSRYVDLYLNGEYMGLYLLCERNEVHGNRVDLSGAGSFLVCKDGQWRFDAANKPYIMTQSDVALRIHYAETDAQSLLEHWQSAENAILAQDGLDPVTGKHWTELIDLESWVLKYLIEETFGNGDAMTYSQFFYYDSAEENPKIHAGPVWDYDLSIGAMPEGSCPLFLCKPDVYGSPWYPALYQKDVFYDCLTEVYETRIRPAMQLMLDEELETTARQIGKAAQMDALRWWQPDINGAETIRTNLEQRMAFLDRLWLGEEEFCLVTVRGYAHNVLCYAVEAGGNLPQLPDYADMPNVQIHGWFYQDTDEPVDFRRPITEDVTVYMKYDLLEQENGGTPEASAEEPIGLLRILPLILFLCVFASVVGIGIWQGRREKQRGERME